MKKKKVVGRNKRVKRGIDFKIEVVVDFEKGMVIIVIVINLNIRLIRMNEKGVRREIEVGVLRNLKIKKNLSIDER